MLMLILLLLGRMYSFFVLSWVIEKLLFWNAELSTHETCNAIIVN